MKDWPTTRQRRDLAARGLRLGLVVVAASAFLLLVVGIDFYTALLWFDSVGYQHVFLTVLWTKIALFVAGALLFLVPYVVTVAVARRLAYRQERVIVRGEEGIWTFLQRVGSRIEADEFSMRSIHLGILLAGAFLAVIMGLAMAGQWETALRYLGRAPFGLAEPAFGQDVGFYVFELPAYDFLCSWLLGAVVLLLIATTATYGAILLYELGLSVDSVLPRLDRGIKTHLAVLVALFLLLMSVNHLLDRYGLVLHRRGAVYGAGYTDLTVQAPAQIVMAVLAALAAALVLASVARHGYRLAAGGVALWLVGSLLVGGLYPSFVQSAVVRPDELARERPYLAENIRLTRLAFGLDRAQEIFFPYEDMVAREEVLQHPEIVQNIRLWDHRPLLQTFERIQSLRPYYSFLDVDVDRYTIDGQYRQVMLSARELVPERLPREAHTWVNLRLVYTHGYGVAMAPVNEVVGEEGLPRLFLKDVPPVGNVPLERPEIYYGEANDSYVVVNTTEPEFDYPREDENVFTRFEGGGGVGIGSLVRRLAYAWQFGDVNILLSSAIQPESRVLYRRNIVDRARHIAPFLLLDQDPYLVVADGKLHWIIDAYTYSQHFPYSEPWRGTLNYIRNSVKVVVDAYDGSVRYYVAEPSDPVIQAYQRAVPGLFQPLDAMPASLREHVRYPEQMFRIQADMLLTYHMQDPGVFYNREDAWAIPMETLGDQKQPVEPYYVITRLPGERQAEFVLVLPFTPAGKQNMIGWLAARMDGEHYGKLLTFKYPKERLVFGPEQIEARIDQDSFISQQFALWNQSGSRVIRGNLLVIPIGQSNLYIEPIYLQAQQSPFPEFKRVILATGNAIAMEPTLDLALARIYGTPGLAGQPSPGAGQGPTTAEGVPTLVAQLAREAREHFAQAGEALKAGDWARYGEKLKAVEETLQRLVEATGR